MFEVMKSRSCWISQLYVFYFFSGSLVFVQENNLKTFLTGCLGQSLKQVIKEDTACPAVYVIAVTSLPEFFQVSSILHNLLVKNSYRVFLNQILSVLFFYLDVHFGKEKNVNTLL